MRDVFELHADHVQGDGDVDQGLDRDQQVSHGGDAFDSTNEHQAQQHRQAKAGIRRGYAERVIQRMGDGVGLQAVECKAEGHQQQERHDHAQPALAQAVLNIERRAATILAFGVAAFVELAEGAFEETAGHADQGSDPHPEYGARATEGDGDPDTGDVTGADATGKAQHQGLERTQLTRAAAQAVAKDSEHVKKVT